MRQNFQFFQPLNITFMWNCDFYRCEHIQRDFKIFLELLCTVMQLLWTAVSYSSKKCLSQQFFDTCVHHHQDGELCTS